MIRVGSLHFAESAIREQGVFLGTKGYIRSTRYRWIGIDIAIAGNHKFIRECYIRDVQAFEVDELDTGAAIAAVICDRPLTCYVGAQISDPVEALAAGQIIPGIDVHLGESTAVFRYIRIDIVQIQYVIQIIG
ncbi:MAG: hypothetical protein EAY75_01320, partial [Bacteroidetes bacterium]